ncbi:MAG: glycolate oxidase subunit GlcF [Azospirillum sp.]|nr:glycolate oxidase subunit GlcF [Azospirillum sp.]
MQTTFTLAQLADPEIQEADRILRACVHCGFCTATCPTYVLRGDELDSPRGRIYLIKNLLESEAPATAEVAVHIDRCLTCLSCMTTCPSGVHYMHLVDHARGVIEKTLKRPLLDRVARQTLALLLPRPALFRLALLGAAVARPFARLLPGRMAAMFALLPPSVPGPSWADRPQVHRARGPRRKRVALHTGCAQQVVGAHINEATVRLLTRHGVEVVIAKGAGCCGAVTHHMGMTAAARRTAGATIAAWSREIEGEGLDAIIINASGCGTSIKDFGFLFRNEEVGLAEKAARVSALARDVTEFLAEIGLASPTTATGQTIAYHSACSMQHGQRLKGGPPALLAQVGFTVREPAESHLCCGSAGTYNMLQPDLAGALRARKVGHLEATAPAAIAAGNLGCITQIASGTAVPVVHTVELLDWATGGPLPAALAGQPAFGPG